MCLAENSPVSIDGAKIHDSNVCNHLFRITDAPFTNFRNNGINNTMRNISTCTAASMTTATIVNNIIVNDLFYLINCDFHNNVMNTANNTIGSDMFYGIESDVTSKDFDIAGIYLTNGNFANND